MGDAMATLIACGVRLVDRIGQGTLGSIDVLLIASREVSLRRESRGCERRSGGSPLLDDEGERGMFRSL
jgi:hypothetical protein